MIKGYLLSLGLILIWVMTQITVFQIRRPTRKFLCFTLLYFLTLPAYVVLYFATPPDLGFLPPALAQTPVLTGFFNGLLVHLLLYCTYGEFFFYVDRPLTLQMLVEFLKQPDGTLTALELSKRYSMERMIRERLASMVHNRYLVKEGDRFRLTPKGECFGRIFTLIRAILGTEYYLKLKEKAGYD